MIKKGIAGRLLEIEKRLPQEQTHYEISITVYGNSRLSESFKNLYTPEIVKERHEFGTIAIGFVDTDVTPVELVKERYGF